MKGQRRKMGTFAFLLTGLLALVLCVGGCWSRRELEDTFFVLSLGLEEAKHGRVRLVVQAAVPSKLSEGGKGEGGGGGGSGEQGPVWVASAEGPTVFAALRELEKRVTDRLFLAHARIVLFDEKVARHGIGPVLDYANREPQIRETIALLITPDSPEKVLKTIPTQEKIPVFYLDNLLEHARLQGASVPLDLETYRIHASLPGVAVAVPRLRLYRPPGAKPDEKPSEFILEGMGIFRNHRLRGYLPPASVPGLLWVRERVRNLPVTFHDPSHRQTLLSAEVLHARCRRKVLPDLQNPGQTRIRLEVKGEANLREIAAFGADEGAVSDVRALNRALSREVAHQIWRSLTAARRYQADIFGLAEEAREALPANKWEDLARTWPETFARCPVDVRVDLRLRRRGMTF